MNLYGCLDLIWALLGGAAACHFFALEHSHEDRASCRGCAAVRCAMCIIGLNAGSMRVLAHSGSGKPSMSGDCLALGLERPA